MKLTFIGAGKMGEALARGIIASGQLTAGDITLADLNGEQLRKLATELGVATTTDNTIAVKSADVVILAVKPNLVPLICTELSPILPNGIAVLSIAAGVKLQAIATALARPDLLLARAMPNTPCLVGAGAVGLSFADKVPTATRTLLHKLLTSSAIVEEVPESLLDAVTGLSGSGPAYVAIIIEALADGGVQMGLPRATAQRLAAQTVYGTAKLQLETGMHPAELKDAVSSPGGTTIAALATLEENGLRHALIQAVKAATLKSKELGG